MCVAFWAEMPRVEPAKFLLCFSEKVKLLFTLSWLVNIFRVATRLLSVTLDKVA